MKKPVLLALVLTLAVFCFANQGWGRAGGGNSYSGDSRSRSSSSSSSRSSSSGSSSRSSSSGSSSHSYSSGSTSNGYSSGSSYHSYSTSTDQPSPSRTGVAAVLIIGLALSIILLIIFYFVYRVFFPNSYRKAVQMRDACRRMQEASTDDDHEEDDDRSGGDMEQSSEQIKQGLARITQRDPSFTGGAFVTQASDIFSRLQQAWSLGQLDGVRSFISDGVLRRFTVQLALDRFHGKRNVTADGRIASANIVGVESDQDFDTVHVRFKAAARDCYVAPNLGDAEAFKRASKAPLAEFVETWSFVRRLDAAKKPSQGKLAQGQCPSCGAPVQLTASATCEYCQAILNSGTYDWVLSEITQQGEFNIRASRNIDGFSGIKRRDPAINRQVLEDRACLVFWKWVEANATGNVDRFARLCIAPVLDKMQSTKGKPSPEYAQTAIGGVDLVLVERDQHFDRAWFEIRWSTAGAGAGQVRNNVLLLAREVGIKTNAKTGLSTDRCHNCGAVQTDSEAATCSYCSALLSRDWAFEKLEKMSDFRSRPRAKADDSNGIASRQAARRTAQDAAKYLHYLKLYSLGFAEDAKERQRTLAVLVNMAHAGEVLPEERLLILACAVRMPVGAEEFLMLLHSPAKQLADLAPNNQDEADAMFCALVAAMASDEKLDAAENKLLSMAAEHLNISGDDARMLINDTTELIYRAVHRRAEAYGNFLGKYLGYITSEEQRRHVLALMATINRVDKKMPSSNERELIDLCLQHWTMVMPDIYDLLCGPKEKMTDLAPQNQNEAYTMFCALVAGALVDNGKISPEKEELLNAAATHLRISPQDTQAIIYNLKYGNL